MSKKDDCPRLAEIAVLQTNHSSMAEDIKEIKNSQKEMLSQISGIKEFITDAFKTHVKESDEKYSTKQEHMESIKKIEELETTHKNSLMGIIALLTSIVLGLIGVVWNNIDKFTK